MSSPLGLLGGRAAIALVLAALVAWAIPVHADAPAADSTWTYDRMCDGLLHLEPDPERVARVSSLVLERDAGLIAFEEGSLALARPIGGRICAALFVGRGRFRFMPATPVEREQLERLYKGPILVREFQSMLLIFADSTAEELSSAASFGRGEWPGDADIYNGLRDFVEKKGSYVDPSLARTLLEGRGNGYFVAVMKCGRERFRFEVNPDESEQVTLWRVSDHRIHPTEIVSKLRLGGQSSDDLESDRRPALAVQSYVMDIALAQNLKATIASNLNCEVLDDSIRFLHFDLLSELDVDSVLWGDGRAVRFSRFKDNRWLWIDAGRFLNRGERFGLRIRYRGAVLADYGDAVALKSTTRWYPQHDPYTRASFDLTFRYPSQMKLVSVGRRISKQDDGREAVSRWRTSGPTRNAGWQVGYFKEYSLSRAKLPEVTVLISESGHAELGRALIEEGIPSGGHMEKQVAGDVLNSLAFFTHVYGALPCSTLYAAESRAVHGEAFAGMVTLGTLTFQWTDPWGWDDILRAHEVAHQWWPYQVGFKTYHDQWLSEGLAQFSGLWYMQAIRQKNELYFGKLEDWRQRILLNKQAGPIWLGYRLASAPGDYDVIVYLKGAWVLHMLRNYLLDLQTMKEDRFLDLMRGLYAAHRDGLVSTSVFQHEVEKETGEDMTWFFRQWVQGRHVPEYHFAWKSAPADSGKYRVTCRVEQHGVPDGFRMAVPIRVDFGGDRYARMRVWVEKPSAEIELPLLPMEPKNVEFNDLSSVLCSVKKTPWQ